MGRWLFAVFAAFVALFCACGDNGDAGGGEVTSQGPGADGGAEASADGEASAFDVKAAAATTNTSVTVTFDAPPNPRRRRPSRATTCPASR